MSYLGHILLIKIFFTSLLRKSSLLNINKLYLYGTNMDAYNDR